MSVPHDHCDARPPTVIFLALEQHTPFTSAKLYWYHLVTEARVHKLSYSIQILQSPALQSNRYGQCRRQHGQLRPVFECQQISKIKT